MLPGVAAAQGRGELVGDLVAYILEYGFRRFPVPIGVGDIGNRGGETEVRADIDRDDFKPALPRVEDAGCIFEPVLQCCALNLQFVGEDVRPEGLAAGSAGRLDAAQLEQPKRAEWTSGKIAGRVGFAVHVGEDILEDRKSTRLNSSH